MQLCVHGEDERFRNCAGISCGKHKMKTVCRTDKLSHRHNGVLIIYIFIIAISDYRYSHRIYFLPAKPSYSQL